MQVTEHLSVVIATLIITVSTLWWRPGVAERSLCGSTKHLKVMSGNLECDLDTLSTVCDLHSSRKWMSDATCYV